MCHKLSNTQWLRLEYPTCTLRGKERKTNQQKVTKTKIWKLNYDSSYLRKSDNEPPNEIPNNRNKYLKQETNSRKRMDLGLEMEVSSSMIAQGEK